MLKKDGGKDRKGDFSMKKSKILIVGLIALLMAGALFIASCMDNDNEPRLSCDDQNNCSAANNAYYCGRFGCAANYGSRCKCL